MSRENSKADNSIFSTLQFGSLQGGLSHPGESQSLNMRRSDVGLHKKNLCFCVAPLWDKAEDALAMSAHDRRGRTKGFV